MDVMRDYFICDSCENKDFTRIFNFSIRFYTVNFSDELIYDRLADEIYQCTRCKKTFTKEQIDNALTESKKKRRIRG